MLDEDEDVVPALGSDAALDEFRVGESFLADAAEIARSVLPIGQNAGGDPVDDFGAPARPRCDCPYGGFFPGDDGLGAHPTQRGADFVLGVIVWVRQLAITRDADLIENLTLPLNPAVRFRLAVKRVRLANAFHCRCDKPVAHFVTDRVWRTVVHNGSLHSGTSS